MREYFSVMLSNTKIAFILAIIFFVIGLVTLTDYGINWDTINHLPRGQTYLHYFLTGKKDYSDLLPFQNYFQDPAKFAPSTNQSRSFYQSDATDFNWFMENDGHGHPPLSDILSSVFNRILYGKLHLINDIDAYHVYGIFLAAILVGLIFYWVSENYGKLAGIIASISLAMYPLFWSESHFNTEKDIPEVAYWSFFIFCVWKGITKRSIKWVLFSGIFLGLALGTKFNILFSIFVIIPWLIFYLILNKEKILLKLNLKIGIALLIALGIGIGIFVGSWPYLWPDPIGRIGIVISFYKGIGTATGLPDPRFTGLFGLNLYPLIWLVTTTPPVTLILAVFGIFFSVINFRKNKQLTTLFLLWLIIPIARVTWGQANIYGGIRQIMEYVPALAILAGIGGGWIIQKFRTLKFALVSLTVAFLLLPLLQTHPNENTYFNFLIGGLSGARDKNIPSWGNTFGSAYREALNWININAPKNSNLDLVYELNPNIPTLWVRQDINFAAINRSGFLKYGEYALTLNYQGTAERSYYDMYLNTFLNPVYQSKVDGVAVVTVWKNDVMHLKGPWIEKNVSNAVLSKTNTGLKFDLGNIYKISRLDMTYREGNCSPMTSGYFEISVDDKKWTRFPGNLPDDWLIPAIGPEPRDGKFVEPFVGQEAQYIKFNLTPAETCLIKNYTSFKVLYLE